MSRGSSDSPALERPYGRVQRGGAQRKPPQRRERRLRQAGDSGWPVGAAFERRYAHKTYIFLRYCPPTSNIAAVNCPSEQYFVASISTSNMFSFRIAACCRSLIAFAASSL